MRGSIPRMTSSAVRISYAICRKDRRGRRSRGGCGTGSHALIDVQGRAAHAIAAAVLAEIIDDPAAQFLASLDGEAEGFADPLGVGVVFDVNVPLVALARITRSTVASRPSSRLRSRRTWSGMRAGVRILAV